MAEVEQAEVTTEAIIAGMLKENTGRHFLDSGGACGRNWQHNQSRSFEDEPAAVAVFDTDELLYTKNVYHFLVDSLEYCADMQAIYDQYTEEVDPDYKQTNSDLMDGFWYWLNKQEDYKDMVVDGGVCNTYGCADALSQIIQYRLIYIDGDEYVLLQIHGGCDIRGGYTDPKLFTMTDDWSLARNCDGDLYCENGHRWYTDDAHHWSGNDYAEYEADLANYGIIDAADILDAVGKRSDGVLSEFVADSVEGLISQFGSVTAAISGLQSEWEQADKTPEGAYIMLVMRELKSRAEADRASSLDLPLTMPISQVERMEEEADYYQRIIDRLRHRRWEVTHPAVIVSRYGQVKSRTLGIMERQQGRRRQAIDTIYRERRDEEALHTFVLSENKRGFCPLCSSELHAY